jgi:carboxyl-terminal processing protease
MQALRTLIISAASIALLNACGGGGGSGGSNTPVNTPDDGWVAGVYDDASQFENQCANPRSGTDPDTGNL